MRLLVVRKTAVVCFRSHVGVRVAVYIYYIHISRSEIMFPRDVFLDFPSRSGTAVRW